MANCTHNLLDFQDPGMIDDELLDVPGFVNELTDYTLSQAHSPNRTLAFLGATAMLSHLAGRTYVDTHGTRTNLYLVALGETGIGKDAPRRVNRQLADSIGDTRSLADSMASGEALEELMVKRPAVLFQPDEAESFFGAMRGNGKASSSLSERVRRLYSASAGMYSVRSTAKFPEGAVIANPHLTMFATGTPEAFYNSLDSRAIVNGLFGRCLVLEVRDDYRSNIPTLAPLPNDLIDLAKWQAARSRNAEEHEVLDLITVDETPAAKTALISSADYLMAQRKKLAEMELHSARALVVRMNEKIAKLAMIYAISESPEHPLISIEAVNWAVKFVAHVTKLMLFEAQFHVAEGKFDALLKRFTGLLAKHGGSLDRRSLLRWLHIDHVTFRRIVTTLHLCDAIIEETESGRNAIYTLKSAA